MSDYDKSIHSNPDAQAWARFFIDTMAEQSWRIEDIDEGLMTGWFANAMMAMHDHVKREWVGLTDEEVGGLTVFDGLTHIEVPILADFVRATEAKLKEKNNDTR
jgi:hypothetical protein